MYFRSDNTSGASPRLLEAINRAAAGSVPSYGTDEFTTRAIHKISEIFDRKTGAFFVATGTAANALALSALTPPWGAILCHDEAHIKNDECGAPELFTGGAKLVGMPGEGGKISPEVLAETLKSFPRDPPHSNPPKVLSLTQVTECGLAYSREEITSLCSIARKYHMAVHMDGARFANAVAATRCSPADMTWRAGVHVLTLGATKDGALGAEAIVFFDRKRAKDFSLRVTRAGQLISKSRWMGAQFEAWLDGGHWLDLARTANARASELAASLASVPGVSVMWKPDANLVFAVLTKDVHNRLRQAGATYSEWARQALPGRHKTLNNDEVFVRFACSFNTTRKEVDALVRNARGAGLQKN